MCSMKRPKWPRLRKTNPADVKEHALSLRNDFRAVQEFLRADLSDVAPSLPKGINHKIIKGIQRGLAEVESREYSSTCISTDDRDLVSSAISQEIKAKIAASFCKRVPDHLFRVLQDSYNELCLKLVNEQDAATHQRAGMAGITAQNSKMPSTPPESSQEESDSAFSGHYGSDTEAIIYHDRVKDKNGLQARAAKLEAQLQEVQRERKDVRQQLREKASKLKKEIQEVELENNAADEREGASREAMELKRSEQDRTGDYESMAVGYNAYIPMEMYYGKQDESSRCIVLKIQNQVVINRLFNMPQDVMMRKVRDAVLQKRKQVGNEKFSSITHFLGPELLDDGNIELWANSTSEYDFRNFEIDTFDVLAKMPSWDQAIFASFARHLTEPSDTYPVEVKDVPLDIVDLRDRKRKAAVITNLVQQNLKTVPSLHIDVFKDIRITQRRTNNTTQALVLDFADATTANGVIHAGLQWEGRCYYSELFDIKFYDRCGNCQAYGHYADACPNPSRCGRCSQQHRTKLCDSLHKKCALCGGLHISRSAQCQANRFRKIEKLNARFPLGEKEPSPTVSPKEPKRASLPMSSSATHPPPLHDEPAVTVEEYRSDSVKKESSPTVSSEQPKGPVSSPATQPPTLLDESVITIKKCPSNSIPTPLSAAPSTSPTSFAQRFGDKLPAIDAAFLSDMQRLCLTETGKSRRPSDMRRR